MHKHAGRLSLIVTLLILCSFFPRFSQARTMSVGTGPSAVCSAPAGSSVLSNANVTDASVSGSTVSVSYYTQSAATLYVQILADAGGEPGTVLQQRNASVSATGDSSAKQSFSFSSLPDCYFIRAWLTASARSSQVYEDPRYSESVKKLLDSSPADTGAPERTVELWGSGKTGGYVVLKEGGHVFSDKDGFRLAVADDGSSYTIAGASNSAFAGVETGDVLCFIETQGRSPRTSAFDGCGSSAGLSRYYGFTFMQVTDCSVSGSSLVLTSSDISKVSDLSELFETVCIRGSGELYPLSYPIDIKALNGDYELTGTMNCKLDADLLWNDNTKYVKYIQYTSFDNMQLIMSKGLDFDIPIVPLDFPLIPPVLMVGIHFGIGISVSASGTLLFGMKQTIGFSYRNGTGTDLSGKPVWTYDATRLGGDLKFSLSGGPELNVAEMLELGFATDYGIHFHLGLSGNEGGIPSAETWHACAELKCLFIEESLFIELAFYAQVSVKRISFPVHTWEWPLMSNYHSFTFNEDGDGTCPHLGYRVLVAAEAMDRSHLEGVSVTYSEVPEHYESKASAVTPEDGVVWLFVPPGEGYTVTGTRTLPNGVLQTASRL